MRKKANGQTQIRLEPQIYSELLIIQKDCDFPVSLTTLANYAAINGMADTRKTFNLAQKAKVLAVDGKRAV
jgi:hypothetical protein